MGLMESPFPRMIKHVGIESEVKREKYTERGGNPDSNGAKRQNITIPIGSLELIR